MALSMRVGLNSSAFCKKTKSLLCINCILQDKNKQHELISIEDGFNGEVALMKQIEETLKEENSNLQSGSNQVETHIRSINSKLEERKSQVSEFFKELRQLLDKKEQEQIETYQALADTEMKKTISYKTSLDHRQLAISESLELLKELSAVNDRYVVLTQSKKVMEAIGEFKPLRQERLVFYLKEFKSDLEIKSIVNELSDEARPATKRRAIKSGKNNASEFGKEASNSQRGQESTTARGSDMQKENNGLSSSIACKQSQSGLTEISTNKTHASNSSSHHNQSQSRANNYGRDYKGKVSDASRDKSRTEHSQKPAVSHFSRGDRKKENAPPKGSQNQTHHLPRSGREGTSQTPSQRNAKKVTKPKLGYEPSDKTKHRESLANSELMYKETESDNENSSNHNQIQVGVMQTSDSSIYLNSSQAAGNQLRKVTDLERARALKKAALKMHNLTNADKIATPTKQESLNRSSTKSINKKMIVESSAVSDKNSMRLTTVKMNQLPEPLCPSIFIIGGYGSDPETELGFSKYDCSKEGWSCFGDKSSFVKSACVKIDQHTVWLIGGKSKGQRLSSIYEIDLKTGQYKTLSVSLSRPKSGCGAVLIEDQVYIIGGNSGESILSEMEVINIKTLEIKKGATLNSRRDEMGVTLGDDGNIYAFGGYGGNNHDFLSTCERYNPKKGRWEMISSMKKARRSLSCLTFPDGIYCIAGFDGKNYLNAVEK